MNVATKASRNFHLPSARIPLGKQARCFGQEDAREKFGENQWYVCSASKKATGQRSTMKAREEKLQPLNRLITDLSSSGN